MKTPKIGDIVHYYGSLEGEEYPCPAIIIRGPLKYGEYQLQIFSQYQNGTTYAKYSEKYKKDHWSWPEEEKQKETHAHVYYHKSLKCNICGEIREDNIWETKENPKDKAQELIDRITSLINISFEINEDISNYQKLIMSIDKLIKEYKGIK